jgi:hypothetical protein
MKNPVYRTINTDRGVFLGNQDSPVKVDVWGIRKVKIYLFYEISGSHGGVYED